MATGIFKTFTIITSSAVVSVFLTPLVIKLGRKFEIIDYPNELSIHLEPKVRAGGIAIFVGILVGISIPIFFGWFDNNSQIYIIGTLLLGVSMIGIVGLLGDLRVIPSQIELAFQFVPAFVVVLLGLRVRIPHMVILSIGLSVFYLVGGASSMNLMDGMDGLASGIAVILSLFIGVVGYIQDDVVVWFFSISLLGSSLGFLYHNFHPA
ncbi:MAG: MraY family glycosyltransferase, partial [Candidatus Thorarchaeota archaeon]